MSATSPLSTLKEEQELIATLLHLIKREQEHLVKVDIDGLAALTPEKLQLIHKMSTLANRRHQSLGAAGFSAKDAGMDAWLTHSQDSEAKTLWRSLLVLTREAKELNRVNGMLINKQMANTQNALRALRSPRQGDPAIYGRNGQSTTTLSNRGFAIG